MIYQCPYCGINEIEKKALQLQVINFRNMKVLKI
jgi:hypothetical protein